MLQFLVKAVDSDDSLSEYLRLTTSLKPLLRSLQLRLAYGICTYSLVSGGRTKPEQNIQRRTKFSGIRW